MTKHTLTPDSITAAKALVSRLCKNGLVRMSVPVDFARDEDMLICALIDVAEKSLVTPTPAASGAAPALPPLPASPLHRFTAHVYTAADMHAYALAALAFREASPALLTETPQELERGLGQAIDERDERDEVIDALCDAVLGKHRAEWSSMYGFRDAVSEVEEHMAALASPQVAPAPEPTYSSTQATKCASCGKHKHTPLRIDAMGGYVCLTCIDQKLGSMLGEFGYPDPEVATPIQVVTPSQPAFWVRRHPDGVLTGEVLSDAQIEPVRRNSGGWLPLYVGAAPVAPQDDARDAAEVLTDEQLDAIAVERYTVVPNPDKVFGYAVHAGNGRGACYRGHRTECESVAARMRTAFLDGAYVARHPESVLSTPAAKPTEEQGS